MVKLRDKLNPEEHQGAVRGPTRHRTKFNRHAMHCVECGELYYVDEHTHRSVKAALEINPYDNPFRCDRCEEEYEEEARSH